jgi:exopolysaccharide biosynthesis polyprenyl glycosylphosphotransferase
MNEKLLLLFLKAADMTAIVLSMALAAILTAALTATDVRLMEMRFSLPEVVGGLAYLAFVHYVLVARGLYESYRFAAAAREVRDITIGVMVCAAILLPPALAVNPEIETAFFVVAFALLAMLLLGIERRGLRAAGRYVRRRGRNLRNVLIVEPDDGTLGLTAKLAKREDLGLHVVGVIAASMNGNGSCNRDAERVRRAIEGQPIDELLIDLPLDRAHALVRRLISICEERGVTVRIISRVAELHWGHAVVDSLDGQPVLTVSSGPSAPVALMAKRAIDVVAAAVGLVLLSPLFAVVALIIKCESRGPVFFEQERVGCNHRRFMAFKFRSMVVDAEQRQAALEHDNEAGGPVFKIRADPRITRFGHFLRRSSIDELPQLFNVLLGEMSLVGPRPLPVRDVDRFNVPWHHRRFSVRPGITCLWQAMHRTPEFDPWVRSDLEYIQNWSLALDLKILVQTIPAVVSGRGAC